MCGFQGLPAQRKTALCGPPYADMSNVQSKERASQGRHRLPGHSMLFPKCEKNTPHCTCMLLRANPVSVGHHRRTVAPAFWVLPFPCRKRQNGHAPHTRARQGGIQKPEHSAAQCPPAPGFNKRSFLSAKCHPVRNVSCVHCCPRCFWLCRRFWHRLLSCRHHWQCQRPCRHR